MEFYIAAIIGTISSFVVGCLWYSVIFGKSWRSLMNFSDDKVKEIFVPKRIITAFLFEWIGTACITGLLFNSSINLEVSLLMVSITVVFTSAKLAIFDGKNFLLILINQGYNLISVLIIGLSFSLFM